MSLLISQPYYFEEKLQNLQVENFTKAHITNIFTKFIKSATHDFSKDSITLIFSRARAEQNFYLFEGLADFILVSHSYFKKNNFEELETTIARLSYYSCYKLLNRQWKSFEELAENYIKIKNELIKLL